MNLILNSSEETCFFNDPVILCEKTSQIKKQLHEAMCNLRSMNVQYNTLEADANVQLEIQKETRLKLEHCNSYIVKLQNELQNLKMEKEVANKTARKAEEHKEQVQDLLEENRRLEDNLSKLCELPFVKDEGDPTVSLLNEQIEELEATNAEYREEMKKLKAEYEEVTTSMTVELEKQKMKYTDLLSKQGEFATNFKLIKMDKETQITRHYKDESSQTNTMSMIKSGTKPIQTNKETCSLKHDTRYSTDNEYKNKVVRSGSESTMFDKDEHTIDEDTSDDDDEFPKEVQSNDNPGFIKLEISANNAKLDDSLLSTRENTMLISHFLDYETIASCQCIGRRPNYNFYVKYNFSLEKYRIELDQAEICFEIDRIDSPQDFEPIAYSSLPLDDILKEQGKRVTHQLQLFTKESKVAIGYLDVIVYCENNSTMKQDKANVDFQGAEETKDGSDMMSDQDEMLDLDSKGKNDITYSESKSNRDIQREYVNSTYHDLMYFENGDDVNYIDFLRFVDPPYPILNQIKNLQMISKELERTLIHHQSSSTKNNNKCEDMDLISEEDFVQTVTMINTRGIELDEIHVLYRHIHSDSERKMTVKRICYFLFSNVINYFREEFLAFRASSINPWRSFKVADPQRTGFVSRGVFHECLRSIGIDVLEYYH